MILGMGLSCHKNIVLHCIQKNVSCTLYVRAGEDTDYSSNTFLVGVQNYGNLV